MNVSNSNATMLDEHVWAVIMAGGSGTRFWPLSRDKCPKQFLSIVGDRSLLQQTWDRSVRVVGSADRVLVVTSAALAKLTREQLPELAPDNLLAEPEARNTAPCLAWTAAVLAERDPEAVMAVFPADHVIRDVDGLTQSVIAATAAARRGYLVTFGVPPRYAETGYGYVELGAAMPLPEDGVEVPANQVSAFREKPNTETAKTYVEAGNFMWNSGMFVWRANTLLEALDEHLPEARAAAASMLAAAATPETGSEAAASAMSEAYSRMPATSIDYGVMEPAAAAANVACVRAIFDWSDVGSWEALHELLDGDEHGNVATRSALMGTASSSESGLAEAENGAPSAGVVVVLDARDNMVHAPGETVALLGVERLAIVRAGDVLLVADLSRSQDIKTLRQYLAESGLQIIL